MKCGNNNEPITLHTTLRWVLFRGKKSSPACSITNKLALHTSTDSLFKSSGISNHMVSNQRMT